MKEEVPEEEARKFANDINAIFYRTSAKEDIGINDLFMEIGKKLGEPNFRTEEEIANRQGSISLDQKDIKVEPTKKKCCLSK